MAHSSEVEMPIGAVTQLTGITSHTLRKWESRYHAIEPIRTDSGRRLYTQDQVDRLLLLRDLVRQGHQISALAPMTDEALRELLGAGRKPEAVLELDRAIVVGEGLPTRLMEHAAGRQVEFVHTDALAWLVKPEIADGEGCALMVELPTIPADAVARLSALRREHFPRVVIVYGFASRKTLRSLMDAGVVCLKNASPPSELLSNLQVAAGGSSLLEVLDREALPSQRFSAESVAQMAAMAPKLQCECPNHIAQLVMDISAFERYSMECEDQNPADRALHARLRLISAHARALFEQAIAELAEHEGFSLEEL